MSGVAALSRDERGFRGDRVLGGHQMWVEMRGLLVPLEVN